MASDEELALEIAKAAGALLIAVRRSGLHEGPWLGQAGDRIANSFILTALRQARPDDAILSEEERDDLARLTKSRVWIIDPLDGTREYSEGRSDWAVHVALAIDGEPRVGAVALPALDQAFSTGEGRGHSIPRGNLPKIVVSRTRPPETAERVATSLGAELVPMGSAGAKAMAVLKGEADIYLHSGGMHEWDSCAPVALALAAGLHASRLDGSPLRYNRENLYLPDLLICRKELVEPCLRLLTSRSRP